MHDEPFRNKLSNFNEKQTSNKFETNLSYSTFSNLNKNTSMKEGRYRLPPNGGREVWEPLSHLLFYYLLQSNFLKSKALFDPWKWVKRA